ncbi:Uncharacterised protein [Chlamydia trachomatis]|nr:Uncharacterised protein [Chlamydia trachomatis]
MYSPFLSLKAAVLKSESKVVSVESNAVSLPPLFLVAESIEYFFAKVAKLVPLFNCLITSSAVDFFDTKIC